jgi:hypothetical protein
MRNPEEIRNAVARRALLKSALGTAGTDASSSEAIFEADAWGMPYERPAMKVAIRLREAPNADETNFVTSGYALTSWGTGLLTYPEPELPQAPALAFKPSADSVVAIVRHGIIATARLATHAVVQSAREAVAVGALARLKLAHAPYPAIARRIEEILADEDDGDEGALTLSKVAESLASLATMAEQLPISVLPSVSVTRRANVQLNWRHADGRMMAIELLPSGSASFAALGPRPLAEVERLTSYGIKRADRIAAAMREADMAEVVDLDR